MWGDVQLKNMFPFRSHHQKYTIVVVALFLLRFSFHSYERDVGVKRKSVVY